MRALTITEIGPRIAEVAHVQALRAARPVFAAVFLLLAATGCRDRSGRSKTPDSEAAARRDAALAAARVWFPPAVPAGNVDFSLNTPGPGGFDPHADVDCTFLLEPISGMTPKFMCTLPGGDRVKVKYAEAIPNGEVSSEIAATRLLAALGFPTDRMNRVHSVKCHGCPPLPQQALQCLEKGEPAKVCLQGASADRVVTFQDALIERPLEGKKIEATKDQGWSWYELDKIDPKAGGSSRTEVDALRLMAILLAHWDNKGANQKLLCPPGKSRPDDSCAAPIAAIGDLGAELGPTRVDLVSWAKRPMWVDAASCRVSMKGLPYDGATFKDQQITESGRQLAVKLLRQLTPQQLNTLFEASGVTAFPHIAAAAKEPQNWTDAFLDKVNQIAAAGPCPNP
jgi:hypothetical protein